MEIKIINSLLISEIENPNPFPELFHLTHFSKKPGSVVEPDLKGYSNSASNEISVPDKALETGQFCLAPSACSINLS